MNFKRFFGKRKVEKEIEATETVQEEVSEEVTEETVEEEKTEPTPQMTGDEECFDVVHQLFEDATTNAMLQMPMWMRLSYFANTISRTGDDADINWDKVNHFLMLGIDKKQPYYNIHGRIKSRKQLAQAAADAKLVGIPEFNMPFYRRRCKQCGNSFELTLGEINSYEKKGLKIPCRCYDCRKGIVKTASNSVASKQEEEPVKTAMQIAMEKAGVC